MREANNNRPNEATEIFFIGMGNAFYGVANLLINRETLYQRVNGVISFVAENPVRAVASHTQVWLSRWYKDVCEYLFFFFFFFFGPGF